MCRALLVISTQSSTSAFRHAAERDYYSFDHGPIHFVQFSTEVNFEQGSDQHAFVIADLAAVDRSKTPWVVAGFHRPYITPTVGCHASVAWEIRSVSDHVAA